MSLVPTGEPISTTLATIGATLLPRIFGGGGPNIAKSLSKQVGFTVLQKDAPMVRDRLSRGLDPRTGLPTGGTVPGVSPPAGVAEKTTGFNELFVQLAQPLINRAIQPVTKRLNITDKEVQKIINQPAVGKQPPIALPPPVPLPTVSREVLQTPARRQVPRRQMVPPRIPPGGGKVSLLAASMSGLPAAIRGGAGLVRTATGRIGRIFLPSGAQVSKRDAAALIRRVGFDAAAVALGITVVEAAELLLQESARKRRGRGITAAQVRNARRTTCMVARLARDLGVKAAPVRRRKTSCR